jgi:hypothetical protein
MLNLSSIQFVFEYDEYQEYFNNLFIIHNSIEIY